MDKLTCWKLIKVLIKLQNLVSRKLSKNQKINLFARSMGGGTFFKVGGHKFTSKKL